MFLFSWFGRSYLCRMPHQAFDCEFFHEVHEPLHRSGGFDPHAHGAWKVAIKLSHDVLFVLQSRFLYLSRAGVQHRQRLLASVQITSYNSHLGLLRSELCGVNTEQSTRAVVRPTSLRHQPGPSSTFAVDHFRSALPDKRAHRTDQLSLSNIQMFYDECKDVPCKSEDDYPCLPQYR